MCNPDGHEYTVTTYRLWRKNSPAGDPDFQTSPGTAAAGIQSGAPESVDLNRNFDSANRAAVIASGRGSWSNTLNDDTYVGTSGGSAFEASALQTLILTEKFDIMADYHAYGCFVLHSPGDDGRSLATIDAHADSRNQAFTTQMKALLDHQALTNHTTRSATADTWTISQASHFYSTLLSVPLADSLVPGSIKDFAFYAPTGRFVVATASSDLNVRSGPGTTDPMERRGDGLVTQSAFLAQIELVAVHGLAHRPLLPFDRLRLGERRFGFGEELGRSVLRIAALDFGFGLVPVGLRLFPCIKSTRSARAIWRTHEYSPFFSVFFWSIDTTADKRTVCDETPSHPGYPRWAIHAMPVAVTKPPGERQNLLLPDVVRWPLDEGKPVIELIDVSVAFGDNQVLDGLSLKIVPGKATVIVGRSGSGKSVLLKLMMGLQRPDSGKVLLFGKDVDTLSQLELINLRKRMSMLFQNYALLDALTVEENVAFTLLENTSMERRAVMDMVHELLDIFELPGTEKLLPSSLSGGMRKRVSLARALIANPEVVLFDEPTTGLDPIMIEKVDQMILLAKRQYHITSVIISHDMASTRRLSDHVAYLHEGKIIFYGTYDEMMRSEIDVLEKFIAGAGTSRLAKVSGGEPVAAAPAPTPETEGEPVVQLIGVERRFGDNHVLRGVDLSIHPAQTTVLIGGSGSGKSVIVKHIMGLFKPDAGEILVFGKDITKMSAKELLEVRRRFGMLFQHAALLDWLTVAENVAFPIKERTNLPRKQIRERVEETLERLHIADIRDQLPGAISTGQKKRVGLARAIVMKPEIMIYDEPTTGQDPIRTRQVDDMIQQAQEEFDITSIVISHDMASTFRIAHVIALLHRGKIAAYGTPDQVRASSNEHVNHFIYAGQVETQ